MAVPHGSSAVLLVNGFALTGFAKSAVLTPTQDALNATVFGLTAHAKLPGLKHAAFSAEMFFDNTTTTGSWDILKGLYSGQSPGVPAPAIISFFPNGAAVAAQAELIYANTMKLDQKTVVSDLELATIDTDAEEDAADHGASLHALGAETSFAFTGTAVDNAAATTNGGVGVVHVTAIAGAAKSITFKIQHSTDNSTWIDLVASFTAITAANNSQRVEVAAGTTIRRYTRVTAADSGTTSSCTFLAAFARR